MKKLRAIIVGILSGILFYAVVKAARALPVKSANDIDVGNKSVEVKVPEYQSEVQADPKVHVNPVAKRSVENTPQEVAIALAMYGHAIGLDKVETYVNIQSHGLIDVVIKSFNAEGQVYGIQDHIVQHQKEEFISALSRAKQVGIRLCCDLKNELYVIQ